MSHSKNLEKTKVMSNGNLQITIKGERLEHIDRYVYLGQMILVTWKSNQRN